MQLKHCHRYGLVLTSISLTLITSPIYADHSDSRDNVSQVIVTEQQFPNESDYRLESQFSTVTSGDSATLFAKLPGGSVNGNGPLSSQLQYRGLFGPRLNVTLDNAHINSGGPNWMDPPLHYLPPALLGSIALSPGISSVSKGSGVAGHIAATYKTSEFSNSDAFSVQGDITTNAHSVDDGYNLGGMLGISNNQHRLHLTGSYDDGDDREFDDGTIRATSYERDFFGIGYGFTTGQHQLTFDYRRSNTKDSGNPVFPLDIAFFDSELFQANYQADIGDYHLEAAINYSDIKHGMSNFTLRDAPDFSALPLPPFAGDDRRTVDAEGEGLGYRLHLTRDSLGGELGFGIDGHQATNDASVFDPDFTPFFVTNFNDSEIDHNGIFAEWRGDLDSKFHLEVGVRYEQVKTSTDMVDAFPANLPLAQTPGTPPFAVRMLRDRFNAADRNQTDDNIDWVTKLAYQVNAQNRVEVGLARKTRSPNYQERYLWIPLEINAGLGDGNNYVGNPELDPEVSHQVELAWVWSNGSAYFQPRAYYRSIDDYIQGTVITDMFTVAVSGNANGDPIPLQFTNVDAEIYGFDARYGISFNENWQLDGVVSYTRGKRRDISDNLYRIAPLNTRLSITYTLDQWKTTLETVAFAEQDKISQTIVANSAFGSPDETPGYGLVNLHTSYRWLDAGLSMHVGVENIFDRGYIDHLTGFNRVANSDVPVGSRLPGAGRNLYVSLNYQF